jgi:osmoprotectant transport system permease protein
LEASIGKMRAVLFNRKKISKIILISLYSVLLYLTAIDLRLFEYLLKAFFPDYRHVIYPDETPLKLLTDHLTMAFVSSICALIIASIASLFIYSRPGRDFRDPVLRASDFLQTLPSVAIIGIVVPIIGYGIYPVIIALVAYSILPLMVNIIKGFDSIPADIVEAASGLGLSSSEVILRIKLPLAFPAIVSGIKNVLIINISAATLGALVGAGGYGVPIIAGIHDFNTAYIIQGAVPSTILALLVEEVMS